MAQIERTMSSGARLVRMAGVLLVDAVLATAGIIMLVSYIDERERAAAGAAPVATRASQGASSEVMDQLTRQVGMTVERRNEQLQRCYTQASRQTTASAPLAGRLDLRFELTPAGRARSVRVDSNTIGSSELARCVVALFESWTFPAPPGNEPVELVWPLRFKAPK